MPEEGVALTPNEELLTASEIGRLARLFAAEGVDKVRLTGGEPTVRRDLAEIIGNLKAVPGIEKVGITTNGIALKRKLESLKAAGLDVINISLDTLVAAKYDFITRRSGLATVIECIDMATEMDFDAVKINCVVMNGVKEIQSLTIDPEVVSKDDVEMLQDLIVAAINDAQRKVDETVAGKMGGLMGGLKIPGLT